jgi:hypothetical protein
MLFGNYSDQIDASTSKAFTWLPALNGGLSVQWLITKRLYLEAGAEYSTFFIGEGGPGFINPTLGMGAHF